MRKYIYLLILIAVLTGCSSVTGTVESQTPQSLSVQSTPTQDINKGVVTGRIITDVPEERNGLMIYLGEVIIDSNGAAGGFLDKQKAPSTLLNGETGVFTIRNVPSGQYTLIIYEVVLGGKAYIDDKGNTVVINVEPGKTTDLGDIFFPGF